MVRHKENETIKAKLDLIEKKLAENLQADIEEERIRDMKTLELSQRCCE